MEFDQNHLQRIAEELTKLEDSTTNYHLNDAIDVDNVVRFIETSKSLRRAAFWNSHLQIRDAVIARLHNWRCVVETDGFTFMVFYRNDTVFI